MNEREPELTITEHPEMPEEFAITCPLCAAERGVPCRATRSLRETHSHRRAAWLIRLGEEHADGYTGFDLCEKVLEVVEELSEADQLRWTQDHLSYLWQLAFGTDER